jgi:hypothetical protein
MAKVFLGLVVFFELPKYAIFILDVLSVDAINKLSKDFVLLFLLELTIYYA